MKRSIFPDKGKARPVLATQDAEVRIEAITAIFTSTTDGLVPASGGVAGTFLRSDATFASPTPNVLRFHALTIGLV